MTIHRLRLCRLHIHFRTGRGRRLNVCISHASPQRAQASPPASMHRRGAGQAGIVRRGVRTSARRECDTPGRGSPVVSVNSRGLPRDECPFSGPVQRRPKSRNESRASAHPRRPGSVCITMAVFQRTTDSMGSTSEERMGSTSDDRRFLTEGVTPFPDNSTFDLNQRLADTALRRDDVIRLFEYIQEGVPSDSNGPLSSNVVDACPPTTTDLSQISENEGRDSTSVNMEFLDKAEEEASDDDIACLLLIYPDAKVEGNRITVFHHRFVVRWFLYNIKVSQFHIEAVPYPKALARLLRRLSGELKSVPTFESDNLFDRFSDPTDYDGCLGEMLSDMDEYIKSPEPSLPDGFVYVRRGTDTYIQFLLAAANEFSTSSS